MKTVQELLDLLRLNKINDDLFVGYSKTVGSKNVFGGQALAQALYAACKTVENDRICHSLHAYFILPGDLQKSIRYKVSRVRDGGSFTTRYVNAEQNGKSIFVLACSFQIEESGLEFQMILPEVPHPDVLMSWEEIYEQTKEFLPKEVGAFLSLDRPITFKPTVITNPFEKVDLPPTQNIWFRLNNPSKSTQINLVEFHSILAYVSDYNILFTALQPHASQAHFGNMRLASLDHAMWFHREPDDFNNWFLYSIEVENTGNARGLAVGKIFEETGKLIATVTQEGLMRKLVK